MSQLERIARSRVMITSKPVDLRNGDVRALIVMLEGPRTEVNKILERVKSTRSLNPASRG